MIKGITRFLKQKSLFELLFMCLLIAQLFVLIFFNIFEMKNHIGFDSSWNYLRAFLMSKEKALFSANWAETTNTQIDTPVLLATIIYSFTGNLLLSYGLANLIIVGLILATMWNVLSLLGKNNISKLIVLNLIVCPYLTNGFYVNNDLGYFSCLLSGAAYYGLRTLIVLLIIYEYLYINKNSRNSKLAIVTLVLCAIAGASEGFYVLFVIFVPYIIFELEMAFWKNEFKILKRREAIFSYLGFIAVFAGKYLFEIFSQVKTIDAQMSWTTLENFWNNIGIVLLGFMKLIGVLPITGTVNVLSIFGIVFVFQILIFIYITVGFIYTFNIAKQSVISENYSNKNIIFFVNIFILNYLMFGMCNFTYGSPIFEERYLIPSYMVLLILGTYLGDWLINSEKNVFSRVMIIILFMSILCNDLVSDVVYHKCNNDSWQMQEIVNTVNNTDAQVAYVYGEDLTILAKSLRAFDLDRVYKAVNNNGTYQHWGDYLYYDNNQEYTDGTVLIISKENEALPETVLEHYAKIQELDTVDIYYCDYNPTVGVSQ